MAGILNYWRAVEVFNPQPAPKAEPGIFDPVYIIHPDEKAPWEQGHRHGFTRPPENCLWRFVIYAGLFPLLHISAELETAFGRDPEALDERVEGTAAVLSLALTHRGQPLTDSFILSSSAWALSRLKEPGPESPQWLSGFESTEAHIKEYVESVFADKAAEPTDIQEKFPLGRPVTSAELFQLLERVFIYLKLSSPDFETRMMVRCVPVSFKKYKNADDLDVLNSFFIKDLARASKAVSLGKSSAPLSSYLSPQPSSRNRTDVRAEPPLSLCWKKLRPSRFPSAKWPSPNHHPLVYSQQIAVNELLEELKIEGLFGVNGPPGTGKTTLLRDIIAALITKRAEALSQLSFPGAGFSGHFNWKQGTWQRRINALIPSLQGFEMVVASSNNGAVENVTLELPTMAAIDPSWVDGSNYFPDFASKLTGTEAWALVSARLGNKANRREFLSQFWFGEELESESEDARGASRRPQTLRNGFQAYLRDVEERGEPIDWKSAVLEFRSAQASENEIRKQRESAWSEVIKFSQIKKDQQQRTEKLEDLRKEVALVEERLARGWTAKSECSEKLNAARFLRHQHHSFKPSWWMVLWTLGKAYREWREPDLGYQKAIAQAEHEVSLSEAESKRLSDEREKIAAQFEADELKLREVTEALTRSKDEVSKFEKDLSPHFPYAANWNKDDSSRELSSPWMDEEWTMARTRVFLAALKLHRSFIHANAKELRQNLDALADVLSGNLPSTAQADAVRAAWSSLFVVIPVISTTFASFDRLFPFHAEGSIGCLFIDEAGQATPQAAAGALWRSRRAVVVGDPLQLEPILTLPFTAQDSLCRHFSVSPEFRPGSLSCQRLADEASSLGTWISTFDRKLWVGAPLRVHRRCDMPMFEISNRVAYDGLMINGTPYRGDLGLAPSAWLDVRGTEADSHWIREEGEATEGLLRQLLSQGVEPSDIFLISPFRAVVRELWQIAWKHEGIHAGTIHTVQGKEANVVILVLGGNPEKPGAKDWAARKPNLVNVAVSRARRRIYVIGNKAEWQKRRFFDTLSSAMEHKPEP